MHFNFSSKYGMCVSIIETVAFDLTLLCTCGQRVQLSEGLHSALLSEAGLGLRRTRRESINN